MATAVGSAFPSQSVLRLIEGQLPDHELHFREASVVRLRQGGLATDKNDSYLWLATWELLPSRGGFTGRPWIYHGITTDRGEVIVPAVSLWSAFPLHGPDRFIRCEFDSKQLEADGQETQLFGDEIARRAKKLLVDFANEHSLKSVGGIEETTGQGEPLQWRLQTQRLLGLGTHQVWQLEFVDESLGAFEALDARALTVWATLDGRLSTLSVGGEW